MPNVNTPPTSPGTVSPSILSPTVISKSKQFSGGVDVTSVPAGFSRSEANMPLGINELDNSRWVDNKLRLTDELRTFLGDEVLRHEDVRDFFSDGPRALEAYVRADASRSADLTSERYTDSLDVFVGSTPFSRQNDTASSALSSTASIQRISARSDPDSPTGTEQTLVQHQTMSAKAGLTTLSSMVNELRESDSILKPHVDQGTLDRARALLELAAHAEPAAGESRLAAQALYRGEFDAAQQRGDRRGALSLQHKAMEAYLGVKHPPDSLKAEAKQYFLEQLENYLNGRGDGPSLTGADLTPASVLKPSEKVALVIARSMERAVKPETVSLGSKPAYERMTNPGRVGKEITENLKRDLRAAFKPINTSFSTASGESYHSALTPDVAPFPEYMPSYVHSATGEGVLCSDNHRPDRVPNMWSGQYTDAGGNTLFKGVRHGTLSAYGITSKHLKVLPKAELHSLIKTTLPEQAKRLGVEHCAKKMSSRFSLEGFRLRRAARAQANHNRALDLVRFNVQNNDRLMAQINSTDAGDSPRVKLALSSVNLVTPDRTRKLLGYINLKEDYDELRMTLEQDKALKDLSRQEVSVNITAEDGSRRTVRVQVEPLTFSFGVNDLAIGKRKRWFPSWRNADRINRPAIENLLGNNASPGQPPTTGLVAEHLRQLEDAGRGNSQEAKTVRQLADQVATLWHTKAHHAENNEPYALPARLALLNHKLGHSFNYNCKSGKDRTGQLDAEIKYLATRIELDEGEVPEPGADLTDEQRALYGQVVLGSGNHEIQQMNTGSPGYKVKLPSLTRRLGDVLTQLRHMGQGAFVSN